MSPIYQARPNITEGEKWGSNSSGHLEGENVKVIRNSWFAWDRGEKGPGNT